MIPFIKEKKEARLLLKNRRASIPLLRKEQARGALISSLLPKLARYRSILSFHSISDEIETEHLNSILSQEGRLRLPRVEGDSLQIYKVSAPDKELIQGKWQLWEPDPSQCDSIAIAQIDCILVPGLGFDAMRQRIGYGKGHYDRLLEKIKLIPVPLRTIGLGYKEQFFEGILPREAHDVPLDEIILV